MYSIFCTTKVTNCSSVLDTTQIEDLNTNRITRILTTDFPQVEENFPQVEKNFLQVEKNFLQVEKNFLQVEENFWEETRDFLCTPYGRCISEKRRARRDERTRKSQ